MLLESLHVDGIRTACDPYFEESIPSIRSLEGRVSYSLQESLINFVILDLIWVECIGTSVEACLGLFELTLGAIIWVARVLDFSLSEVIKFHLKACGAVSVTAIKNYWPTLIAIKFFAADGALTPLFWVQHI